MERSTPRQLPKSSGLGALRIRVAELCGWVRGTWSKDERGRPAPEHECFFNPNHAYAPEIPHAPPDYPNDLNACLTLIDMLADRGWNCALGNGLDKTWECEFYRPAKLGQTHPDNLGIRYGKSIELIYGSADTLELAICEAFLKTMEASRPKAADSVQEGNETI